MRKTILATKVRGTDETGDDIVSNLALILNPEWRRSAPDDASKFLVLKDDDEISAWDEEDEAREAFAELVEETEQEFRDMLEAMRESRFGDLIAVCEPWIVTDDLFLVEMVARAIRDGKSSEMLQAIKRAEDVVA